MIKIFSMIVFFTQLLNAQINITVVDQGVDKNHSLFKNKISSVISVIENEQGTDDEVDGHGTHVAGIIVNNLKDSFSYKIHIVKNQSESLLNKLRSSKSFDESISREAWSAYIPNAINEAIKNKSQIVNLSQITYMKTKELEDSIRLAQKHNILIIAASGNKNFDLGLIKKGYLKGDKSKPEVGSFPCSFQLDNVICVGNYEKVRNRNIMSNFGKEIIDIFAMGMNIKSACVGGKSNCVMSGTSMSVPRVSALIAKVWNQESKKRKVSPSEISYLEIKELVLNSLKVDKNLIEFSKNGKYLD